MNGYYVDVEGREPPPLTSWRKSADRWEVVVLIKQPNGWLCSCGSLLPDRATSNLSCAEASSSHGTNFVLALGMAC